MSRLAAMQSATFTPDEWQLQDRHYTLRLSDTHAGLHQSYDGSWIVFCGTQQHIWPSRCKSETIKAPTLTMAKKKARQVLLAFNAEVAG